MKPPILRAVWLSRQMVLLRKADKEAVRAAVMPEESPAPPELIASVQEIARGNLKTAKQMVLLSVGGILAGIVVYAETGNKGLILACVFTLIASVMLICVSRNLKHIRDDAAVMRIPIAGIQKKLINRYCYFYLPDGKYRFPFNRNEPQPEALLIIRSGKKLYHKLIGKDEKL